MARRARDYVERSTHGKLCGSISAIALGAVRPGMVEFAPL